LPIEIINTSHVVSMGNCTPCATSAAGSVARHGPVLLIMVGGVGGDFSQTALTITFSLTTHDHKLYNTMFCVFERLNCATVTRVCILH